MGNERDYDREHQRNNSYGFKFDSNPKSLMRRKSLPEPEPLIPVEEGFYTPGEATAEAKGRVAILRSANSKNEVREGEKPQSPQPNQTSNTSSPQKQGWWGKLFNKQQPLSNQLQESSTQRNQQNKDNNPYSAPRSENQRRSKQESPAVENFKQRLRNRANNQLEQNKQQVYELSAAYNSENPNSKPLFDELRAVVIQDGELHTRQNELQKQISNYQSLAAERAMGVSLPSPENQAQLEAQLEQIKQVRATLLAQYPISGLVKTHQVGDDVSDAELEEILLNRFAGINRDIDVAKERISNGDIPLNELDAIIPEILASTPEGQRASVEQYLKKQQRIDTAIEVGGTLGEIGLTAGAIVTGILSGGIIPTILGGLGTALGIGTAAYQFERADDLNLIAKTGDAGGNQLLTQPNKAKQDYLLGWANLVLAGIDGGLAISEGAQVLDSLKAAEKLATRPGASAIYTVSQDKVLQIQRAIDLERAGDPTAASTLFALRKELGGAKFDGVYDTLSDGNLRVIDNAEAATIKGKGAKVPEVDPATLSKWQAKYPNAVIEADGQVIKLNNQIKIHPNKLDEVDEATINKIVNSTQELDAVGGDITKVSSETKKTIEDLTQTGGGRWRFEYQTNGVVNQYLNYVGLKDNELFQNMSDAEKTRLFDIPNQMNYLDEVPANAKKRQRKLETKAQEKMIEQQAASYAIQQNPQDATEFVNHAEFYKTQMKQNIADLEKRYDTKLEAVVNDLAAKEGKELNLETLTQKQIVEVNRTASQEFSQELYGEIVSLDGEKAVDKYIKEKAYKTSGTANNIGQVNQPTKNKIQNAYQEKIADIGDNIGGVQIEANLSSDETIEKIKAIADNLKFGDESAAAYHVEKHYRELPPSRQIGENKFDNYWQSSIETIKNSEDITSSYNQNGSRSFIFKHTYKEQGKLYQLKTIVGVSSNGTVNIRTYFKF